VNRFFILTFYVRIFVMPQKRSIQLHCPTCKKTVKAGDSDFPFCSDRCRLIDLGKWASGAYVIPSPLTDTEQEPRKSIPDDPEDTE
jgi:uncharacterized protein